MKLSSMEMIQEIKIEGEKVYSADYINAENHISNLVVAIVS
jgi:hypothetical protein